MAKYQYVGPEAERGHVPSWGFDDGILDPAHLASLIDRGQVVLLGESAPTLDRIGQARSEGISSEPAPAPAPKPEPRPARARRRR